MARPRKQRKALTVEEIKRAVETIRRAKAAAEAGRARKAAAEAGRSTKDIFLWDGAEHGLAVKITPAGSAVFIMQKAVHGRPKRITLGNFGDVTLEQARTQARVLNGKIAEGRDPVAEERAKREAAERQAQLEKTMQDLWERYATEVVSQNKTRTAEQKQRMWDARVKPRLGKLKVKDVTGEDVAEVVHSPLRKNAAGRVIGGNGEAGNLYRLLRHMFYQATAWGLRPRELGNPLKEVKQPRVERRQLTIGARAIGALLKAADEKAAEGTKPQVIGAIKATILTGARISELLTLRWENVHADESELRWRDTKTGKSERSISPEALKLIKSMGRVPGSPFVFRSLEDPRKPLPYSTVRHAFEAIAAKAGVENCSLHTLRHFFATTTANSVSNPRVGMKLTGHKSLSAYMNYVHAERTQAQDLAAQLGTFFQSLPSAAANVVPAKRKIS